MILEITSLSRNRVAQAWQHLTLLRVIPSFVYLQELGSALPNSIQLISEYIGEKHLVLFLSLWWALIKRNINR